LTGSAIALATALGTQAAPVTSTGSDFAIARAQALNESGAVTRAQKLAQATAPANNKSAESNTTSAPSAAEPTVNDKLRDLLSSASKADRILSRKGERQVVEAFYQKRNYAPLWVEQGKATSRAQDVQAYIKTIDADGLEPAEYSFPNFSATSLDGQAETELKFTAMLLTYARHAMNGRVHWSRITAWAFYKENYNPVDVLDRLADASNVASAMDSLNPQQPQYQALKAKLADLRAQKADGGPARISYGPLLKYGNDKPADKSKNAKDKSKTAKDKEKPAEESVVMMQDPRVPLLREKLGLAAKDDTNFDKELAEAATKFQAIYGLKADGQVGNPTIDALNGPSRDGQINIVLANMERWRWVPRDLGKTHVVLNIPEFTLKVWNEGAIVWTTRVVVGKVGHETPLLSETMKFITVNPTWNVPQSIVYNELLPIYESSDPGIFAKQGLRVEQGRDGIRVYQPPGDKNALGRLRFNFPNKFLVYQHDTSEKFYFERERRAYSHGCMRVQDPVKYADVLLAYAVPKENYTQERIRKMYSDNEINIEFQVQIPVHVTYQTAFVDDAGVLQFRDDLYGLDSKLLSQMRPSERKVADVVIDRPADPNYRPSPTDFARLENVPRDGGNNYGGYGGYSGGRGSDPFGGLFSRIFR
jgi:murein L,D-transpeptidase YcbB/YkuD